MQSFASCTLGVKLKSAAADAEFYRIPCASQDPGTDFLEFSALAANDLYDGMAHSAGDFA